MDRELNPGEHFVVPEVRYLKAPFEAPFVPQGKPEELVPRLVGQGWSYRVFQGRHAMERMICRLCLNECEARDRVWGQMRKQALELERGTEETFYQILCEQV